VKFSANVSILFKEVPFLERFGRAKEAGFSAVEFWWPSQEDLGEVEAAIGDAGLSVALFNFDAGDMPAGERGLVSDPERVEQFRENVPVALDLARRLGCRRMNVLVGHEKDGMGGRSSWRSPARTSPSRRTRRGRQGSRSWWRR
jgi:hydroxypyruvate isomerase